MKLLSKVLLLLCFFSIGLISVSCSDEECEEEQSRFEIQMFENEEVVIDPLNNLMWQQSNLPQARDTWTRALNWISTSNSIEYAGFNDWRHPTIQEVRGLLTDKKQIRCGDDRPEIYLPSTFSYMQCIWSSYDQSDSSYVFSVNFLERSFSRSLSGTGGTCWVRGVRDIN